MRYVAILVTALLLPGCAITSMDAKIAPNTQVAQSSIGHNQTIGVRVVDERPTKDIGNRSGAGGKIRVIQDLEAIYQNAIVDGLRRKGFDARMGDQNSVPNLKVEIRSLSYQFDAGWWTVGARTDSSIKAYVNGAAEPYERLYRANEEKRGMFAAGAKGNNQQLNEVVSDSLTQLFDDQKLLEVLATPAKARETGSETSN